MIKIAMIAKVLFNISSPVFDDIDHGCDRGFNKVEFIGRKLGPSIDTERVIIQYWTIVCILFHNAKHATCPC
jgi:hypothetical protein